MPQPALKSFAQDVYTRLAPVTWDDANQQWALALYVSGIGVMFQVVEDYSREQLVNGKFAPGWSQLLDPNRCPPEALAWLGQFVGAVLPPGMSDAAKRSQLQNVNGWQRGSVGQLVGVAQSFLTGTKTVYVRERDIGPYHLTINTKTSETPNPAALNTALQALKPAGLLMSVNQIVGQDFQAVKNNWATFQLVKDTYLTMQDLLYDNRGGVAPTGSDPSAYYVLLLGGGF